ncbi:hypothetical protein COE01_15085, partial [Bacillus thuringiensis]
PEDSRLIGGPVGFGAGGRALGLRESDQLGGVGQHRGGALRSPIAPRVHDDRVPEECRAMTILRTYPAGQKGVVLIVALIF